ncbi:MAG: hypothetical protein ACLS6H_06385 [Clostridium sp.]
MPQNVWTVKRSEEWEAARMSILSIGLERGEQIGMARSIYELLEEKGSVSENTQKMLLKETDKERLKLWLNKAARSDSEADFLKKIQEE